MNQESADAGVRVRGPVRFWRSVPWVRKILLLLALAMIAGVAYLLFRDRTAADLRVGRISRETPQYPSTAVPYSLPRKRFVISTTTRVTGCVETGRGERISGTTALAVKSRMEVDPEHQYYLYFDSGSKSKNLHFVVESYEHGAMKSISASISDQAAPIAASTLGAATKLIVFNPLDADGDGIADQDLPHCAALQAAIRANPDDPRLQIRQEDEWVPEPPRVRYDDPAYRPQPLVKPVQVSLHRLAAQFDLRAPAWAVQDNASISIDPDILLGRSSDEVVFAPGASPQSCPPGPSCPPPSRVHGTATTIDPPLVKGLVLRNAVQATLRIAVCDATCNSPTVSGRAPELTPQPSQEVLMPQFGSLFLVPVHGGFAQDAAAEVAMSAEGTITRLQMSTTSTFSTRVTALGDSAGKLVAATGSAGQGAADANRKLADCLLAQQQVVKAGGTPVGECQSP